MDKTGGQVADTLGTTFNVGNRFSAVPDHVEVIVATNAFTVNPQSSDSNGSGSGSWGGMELLLFALAGVRCWYRLFNKNQSSSGNAC